MAELEEGGAYWEISIGVSAFLGRKKVLVIQKMKCPNRRCGKRVCDIGETHFRIIIELKCPNCGEIVRVYWRPKEENKHT